MSSPSRGRRLMCGRCRSRCPQTSGGHFRPEASGIRHQCSAAYMESKQLSHLGSFLRAAAGHSPTPCLHSFLWCCCACLLFLHRPLCGTMRTTTPTGRLDAATLACPTRAAQTRRKAVSNDEIDIIPQLMSHSLLVSRIPSAGNSAVRIIIHT